MYMYVCTGSRKSVTRPLKGSDKSEGNYTQNFFLKIKSQMNLGGGVRGMNLSGRITKQ